MNRYVSPKRPHRIQLTLSESEYGQLVELVRETERTANAVFRLALRDAFQRYQQQKLVAPER